MTAIYFVHEYFPNSWNCFWQVTLINCFSEEHTSGPPRKEPSCCLISCPPFHVLFPHLLGISIPVQSNPNLNLAVPRPKQHKALPKMVGEPEACPVFCSDSKFCPPLRAPAIPGCPAGSWADSPVQWPRSTDGCPASPTADSHHPRFFCTCGLQLTLALDDLLIKVLMKPLFSVPTPPAPAPPALCRRSRFLSGLLGCDGVPAGAGGK